MMAVEVTNDSGGAVSTIAGNPPDLRLESIPPFWNGVDVSLVSVPLFDRLSGNGVREVCFFDESAGPDFFEEYLF